MPVPGDQEKVKSHHSYTKAYLKVCVRTCNLHKSPVPKLTDLPLFCKDRKIGYWKCEEKQNANQVLKF